MNYPLITTTAAIIHNAYQLCTYLIRNHGEARHELADDLPELCERFGIVEYVDPPETPKTPEQIAAQAQADLTMTIQNYLDSTARTRNYDGILSLCTYVTSTDPVFAAEGQAGVIWRDACWRKGYEVVTAVMQDLRQIPSAEELLAEMPLIRWV